MASQLILVSMNNSCNLVKKKKQIYLASLILNVKSRPYTLMGLLRIRFLDLYLE